MATKPETAFSKWLTERRQGFIQTIESATGRGIPDLTVCFQGQILLVELKAAPKTNVQLRKEQYAWSSKAHWNGVHTFVINRSPKNKKKIQIWMSPFAIDVTKKDHVKIISAPDMEVNSEDFTFVNLILLKNDNTRRH